MMIVNCHPSYTGLAIEFKSPTGMGKVSLKQLEFVGKLRDNMWLCLVSNCYDEIIMSLVQYFDEMNLDEGKYIATSDMDTDIDNDSDCELIKPHTKIHNTIYYYIYHKKRIITYQLAKSPNGIQLILSFIFILS